MKLQIRLAVGLTALATAGAGVSVGATALAAPNASALPTLTIQASAKGFSISGSHTVTAGRVEVKLVAAKGKYGGAGFGTAKFAAGYTFKRFIADEKFVESGDDKSGNADKAGTKRLAQVEKKVTFIGGTSAEPATTNTVTFALAKGTYTIFDEGSDLPSHPITITVSGPTTSRPAPHSGATIIAKGDDRFGGSTTLPAHGVITFKNATDQDHFAALIRVKTGTTHKQIAAFLATESSGEPPFAIGEARGSDIVSPGHSMTFTESAAKGEYVEICFFQDDKTGMQHAYMGMWRIVHMK